MLACCGVIGLCQWTYSFLEDGHLLGSCLLLLRGWQSWFSNMGRVLSVRYRGWGMTRNIDDILLEWCFPVFLGVGSSCACQLNRVGIETLELVSLLHMLLILKHSLMSLLSCFQFKQHVVEVLWLFCAFIVVSLRMLQLSMYLWRWHCSCGMSLGSLDVGSCSACRYLFLEGHDLLVHRLRMYLTFLLILLIWVEPDWLLTGSCGCLCTRWQVWRLSG